jgi:hypothetical protein
VEISRTVKQALGIRKRTRITEELTIKCFESLPDPNATSNSRAPLVFLDELASAERILEEGGSTPIAISSSIRV